MSGKPSKFTTSGLITEEVLWEKIATHLPKEIMEIIDKNKCKLIETYPGNKEYIINNHSNECIASANISEIRGQEIDWSIYYEK